MIKKYNKNTIKRNFCGPYCAYADYNCELRSKVDHKVFVLVKYFLF